MATYTATTSPMIITSAATVVATNYPRPFLAKRIEWLTPVTPGDRLVATDLNGNIICEGTCEVASQSQILWSGPAKLTFPGKSGLPGGSWQIATINSGSFLMWF
jgi:hypothetical protein